jgi:GTPase SAR1 family protein
VQQHQQRLGAGIETAVATGDRRRSFKLLMAGPDAGGKTSLLFCWKANQPLGNASVDTIPTVYDFNVEEVGYKDLVLMCWDMGGPDDFRAFLPPTADPASVDALVFVVDAVRIRNDPEYCLLAKRELWRHLEGDILSEEIVATDSLLRKVEIFSNCHMQYAVCNMQYNYEICIIFVAESERGCGARRR